MSSSALRRTRAADAPAPGDYVRLADTEAHTTVSRCLGRCVGPEHPRPDAARTPRAHIFAVLDASGEEYRVRREPGDDNDQRRAYRTVGPVLVIGAGVRT